ncbi:hypothetical protein [Mesorhizobium sp. M0019]|uniref:hypothetical protein n=1 Tax=Mesorhizobium sp. M0019 TaxID=2956845 RepID=UPI00333AB125
MAAVLEVFDAIPLGAYMAIVNELRGRVHQRHALAGILTGASAEEARKAFLAAAKEEGTLLPPMTSS